MDVWMWEGYIMHNNDNDDTYILNSGYLNTEFPSDRWIGWDAQITSHPIHQSNSIMFGWMDRWMYRWMDDRQMDVQMDGWMVGLTDEGLDDGCMYAMNGRPGQCLPYKLRFPNNLTINHCPQEIKIVLGNV